MHGDAVSDVTAPKKAGYPPWVVLAAFCAWSATNAFMWLDYAAVPDVTKDAFRINDDELNFMAYAVGVVATCVGMPAAIAAVDRHFWPVLCVGFALNIAGAWLRYVALVASSEGAAIASSCVIGLSNSAIFSLFAPLPARWFPGPRLGLATSLAVQSNYAGAAAGMVVVPALISDAESMRSVMLWQAVVVSSTAVFLIAAAAAVGFPATPTASAGAGAGADACPASPRPSLMARARPLLRRGYVAPAAAYAAMVAISIALPGVQANIFSKQGYDDSKSMWTNFVFNATGVAAMLLVGLCPPRSWWAQRAFIRAAFAVSSAAMVGLVTLSAVGDGAIGHERRYRLYVPLMALSGAPMCFIVAALPRACALARPASSTWAGGALELTAQVLCAVLVQVSTPAVGFWAAAGLIWAATILVLCCDRSGGDDDSDASDSLVRAGGPSPSESCGLTSDRSPVLHPVCVPIAPEP